MWKRRKPSADSRRGRVESLIGPAIPAPAAPAEDSGSWLEFHFPGATEEHPAKRRIRRSNELAEQMRQTGGRHRVEGAT
jgi:hypothetical protein